MDKRPTNTSKAETNDERTTNEQYASYHESPTYHENLLCLLTATHYVVSCLIGNTRQTMLPFNEVFDTGSGLKIVKRDALFDGWENLHDKDVTMPRLGDANGRRLRLLGEITLRIRFGNATYRVPFIVADKLAGNVIIGTRFMNRYVGAIECRTQTTTLFRGATISILSRTNQRDTNTKYENERLRNETTEPTQRGNDAPVKRPHTARLAKHVTVPPLSHMSVSVVTTAAGLVYLEPKQPAQTHHHVRKSNVVIEVRTGV